MELLNVPDYLNQYLLADLQCRAILLTYCSRLMRTRYFWLSVDGLFYLLEITSSRSNDHIRITHTVCLCRPLHAHPQTHTLLLAKQKRQSGSNLYKCDVRSVPLPLKPAMAISLFTFLCQRRHSPYGCDRAVNERYTSNRKQWWRWFAVDLMWLFQPLNSNLPYPRVHYLGAILYSVYMVLCISCRCCLYSRADVATTGTAGWHTHILGFAFTVNGGTIHSAHKHTYTICT